MNDSSYAHDVARNLIAMAKVIFAPTEALMKEIQEYMLTEERVLPQ